MVFKLNNINDIETAKEYFKRYVTDNYGLLVKEYEIKYYHTFRVANLSLEIASKENWNKEDTNIAYLISLFHDIGRFEQWKKYETFWDKKSIDHAQLAIDILKNSGIFSNIDEYIVNIIYESIFHHNKYKIPNNMNDYNRKFTEIIRDADKIDIMNVKLNYYKKLDENYLSETCYNSFLKKESINYDNIKTDLDLYLLNISWWYELYLCSSKQILLNRNYLKMMLDYFPEDDKKTTISNIVNSFIE